MNIPTIDLADKVGMSKILATAEACGISTLVKDGKANDNNLAASIGGLTNGVSLIDMAKAYSVFANGGKLVEPTAILKVVDRNGNVLEDHSQAAPGKQVVSESAVYRLTSILEEVVSRGTGGNAAIGRTAAGKTGTTDDEHDAWFVATRRSSSPQSGSATIPRPMPATPAVRSRQHLARLHERGSRTVQVEVFRYSGFCTC